MGAEAPKFVKIPKSIVGINIVVEIPEAVKPGQLPADQFMAGAIHEIRAARRAPTERTARLRNAEYLAGAGEFLSASTTQRKRAKRVRSILSKYGLSFAETDIA